MINFFAIMLLILMSSSRVDAVTLISDETIRNQKALTKELRLKSGIPLIIRQSEGSEILQVDVNFRFGFRDMKGADKVLADLMFSTMSRSAKDWPKERIFQTLQRFSGRVGCTMGVEGSACKMTSINEYWHEILPLFAASIQAPLFENDDLELLRHNQQARLRSRPGNPDFAANELANRIFYGDDHPYFMPVDQQVKHLESVDRQRIIKLHQRLISAHIDSIVVVSSLNPETIKQKIEEAFGNLQPGNFKPETVPVPGKGKQFFIFEHRDIPTAYIRIKFPMPGVADGDFEAANLMMKVLDEELGLEIRTRRSLSYAVFAYMINYSRGIGMVGVSTSRPEETLKAIAEVINKVRKQTIPDEQIRQYKTSYGTSYFLNMEEHSSLASSLSRFQLYYGSTDPMYEAPARLAKLTAAQVQAVAQKYLRNYSIGVVYDRKQFEDRWASEFIKSTQ